MYLNYRIFFLSSSVDTGGDGINIFRLLLLVLLDKLLVLTKGGSILSVGKASGSSPDNWVCSSNAANWFFKSWICCKIPRRCPDPDICIYIYIYIYRRHTCQIPFLTFISIKSSSTIVATPRNVSKPSFSKSSVYSPSSNCLSQFRTEPISRACAFGDARCGWCEDGFEWCCWLHFNGDPEAAADAVCTCDGRW